jgi:hypothetical protein
LTTNELKERFGAQKSHSFLGSKIELNSVLIDINNLNGNSFKKLLGYINTKLDKQKKGITGSMK